MQGNYSDVLVLLSNIYSDLRGDTSGVKNEDSAQGFVRSTTKYWVRTQDATTVKHHILQHLPVFQFKKDEVTCIPELTEHFSPRRLACTNSSMQYSSRTQDATTVKHHILQCPAVFQFKKDEALALQLQMSVCICQAIMHNLQAHLSSSRQEFVCQKGQAPHLAASAGLSANVEVSCMPK